MITKKLLSYFFLITLMLLGNFADAQISYWHSVGVTVAGITNGSGGTSTKLNAPAAVVVDGSGAIYVADYINGRVQKFPPASNSGTPAVTVAGGNGSGNALNQLTKPDALWIDGSGNLYVADNDSVNPRVLRFPSGSTSSTMGVICAGGNGVGNGLNQFSKADGLFMDAGGNLYVSDYNDSSRARVLKFANAATSTSAASGVRVAGGCSGNCWHQHGFTVLNDPKGICVDGSGNIYVADAGYNRVVRYTSPTSAMVVAGSPATTQSNGVTTVDSLLSQPYDVKMDVFGNLIICNAGTDRIVEWTKNTSSSTGFSSTGFWVAANGPVGPYPSGLGTPQAIWIDNNTPANLYVADFFNFRIQKFWDTTGATAVQQVSGLISKPELFPNPNHGSFTFKSSTDASLEGKEVSIRVINMLGQTILQDKAIVLNGAINKQIEMGTSVAQGIYQLQISCGRETTVSKFEINR